MMADVSSRRFHWLVFTKKKKSYKKTIKIETAPISFLFLYLNHPFVSLLLLFIHKKKKKKGILTLFSSGQKYIKKKNVCHWNQ